MIVTIRALKIKTFMFFIFFSLNLSILHQKSCKVSAALETGSSKTFNHTTSKEHGIYPTSEYYPTSASSNAQSVHSNQHSLPELKPDAGSAFTTTTSGPSISQSKKYLTTTLKKLYFPSSIPSGVAAGTVPTQNYVAAHSGNRDAPQAFTIRFTKQRNGTFSAIPVEDKKRLKAERGTVFKKDGSKGESGLQDIIEFIRLNFKGQKGEKGIPGLSIVGQKGEKGDPIAFTSNGASMFLGDARAKGEEGTLKPMTSFRRESNAQAAVRKVKNNHVLKKANSSEYLGQLSYVEDSDKLYVGTKAGWAPILIGKPITFKKDYQYQSDDYLPLGDDHASYKSPRVDIIAGTEAGPYHPDNHLGKPQWKRKVAGIVIHKSDFLAHLKHSKQNEQQRPLRLIALNNPQSGYMGGIHSVNYQCQLEANKHNVTGFFRAFLSSSDKDLIDLLNPFDSQAKIVNSRHKVLFDSWKSMLDESKGSKIDKISIIQPNSSLYSFNGRNVILDTNWDLNFLRHGSFKNGTNADSFNCNDWTYNDEDKTGLASDFLFKGMLDNNFYQSCKEYLVVLCIEIQPFSPIDVDETSAIHDLSFEAYSTILYDYDNLSKSWE